MYEDIFPLLYTDDWKDTGLGFWLCTYVCSGFLHRILRIRKNAVVLHNEGIHINAEELMDWVTRCYQTSFYTKVYLQQFIVGGHHQVLTDNFLQ